MTLIPPALNAQIRAAIKLATDTFMITPVLIYRYKGNLDRYGEDQLTNQYEIIPANFLVEYIETDGANKTETEEGSFDYHDVSLSANLEDLALIGIVDPLTYAPLIVTESDYFVTNGETFEMIKVMRSGPLDEKQVLLVIKGKRSEKQLPLP